LLRAHGISGWGVVPLTWNDVDALVELGRLDEAEAFVGEMRARAGVRGRGLESAVAGRGHGLVLAARGNLTAAQHALEGAAAGLDSVPFEQARSLMAFGVVLRRDKQKRAARAAFHSACPRFDDLCARLWSAEARQELERIGGRTATAGALTATDRRVAELVAAGHSIRAVADQLFLSTRTVPTHLTSVYAKLGVRSRTEMAHHLHQLAKPEG
jgi:DNA-binding NarL/FixJ family response regulator